MHRDQVTPEDEADGAEGPASRVLLDYFGADAKKFVIFALVLLGAIAVGTVPYILFAGYDKWSQNVGAATNMLLADFPVAASPLPQGPGGYSVIPTAAPAAQALPPGSTRQYTCPSCGASGLPIWTPAGQPTCANCGGLMSASPQARIAGFAAP
jgi:hypothetical protein